MTQLRIFLVDEHPVVRAGVRAILTAEGDLAVVGEHPGGTAAVDAAVDLRPDVVVLELTQPNSTGVEVVEAFKDALPSVQILCFAARDGRGNVQMMLEAGVTGYLLKRAHPSELVAAVRAVAGGGLYLDPTVAAQVVAAPNGGAPRSGMRLSERENEVLRLIAEGYAMKDIATRLSVSTRTLETYRARAMEKLAFKSRVQIVDYALRRGWLRSG